MGDVVEPHPGEGRRDGARAEALGTRRGDRRHTRRSRATERRRIDRIHGALAEIVGPEEAPRLVVLAEAERAELEGEWLEANRQRIKDARLDSDTMAWNEAPTMSITQPAGRFGALLAQYESGSEKELQAKRERYWKALRGECTDADIAELEAGDLTDPSVTGALEAAYEAQDPSDTDELFLGGRRPSTAVSDAELTARIREAEAELERNPKDSDTRIDRLRALAELALRRKQEAIIGEAAAHRAATRERQGLTAVEDCPGWEHLLNALSEAAELHEPDGAPWQVTALGHSHGRLLIESRGGDGVTRGLELLAHLASGVTCQRCGAAPGERYVGLWPLRLCEGCRREEDAYIAKHHLERTPDGELTEAAKAIQRKLRAPGAELAARTSALFGTPEEIAAAMDTKKRKQ